MSEKARIVRVLIEQGESGAFFATSPDLKGLLVSKMTLEQVKADIPRAIAELAALSQYHIRVVVGMPEDEAWRLKPIVAGPFKLKSPPDVYAAWGGWHQGEIN